MWVFAYGSLMNDGWEKAHGCSRRIHATLAGFSRSFDKASVKNWGTKEHKAPTLRIVASNASCSGIAFEFPEERRATVLSELLMREGPTFPLKEQSVILTDGDKVIALVPIYEGRNIILEKDISKIAAMAIKARGTSGSCVDYVRDIANHLRASGINDPVVEDLRQEIEKQLSTKG